jgi:hypothetical protein
MKKETKQILEQVISNQELIMRHLKIDLKKNGKSENHRTEKKAGKPHSEARTAKKGRRKAASKP